MRFASSCIAHSSPARSAPSTRCGSLPSSSSPSAVASRRAGSIVTTATRLPSAASPSARAADVVVFPTPPEPATMTTRFPERFMSAARRARRPARRGPASRRAWACSRSGRWPVALVRRASCARCRRARACAASARWTPGPSGCSSSRRASAGVKRSGARALTTIASSSASRLSRSASCSASVSVTASSSARATATTAVTSGSLSVAWMIDAWRATGPVCAAPANARGALSTATPCPVAGASTMTRS